MIYFTAKEMDLSNTIKNGILYLEDTESQTWNPHFFVLTQSKLLYTEMTSQPDQGDEAEEEEETTEDKSNNTEKPPVSLKHSLRRKTFYNFSVWVDSTGPPRGIALQ